MIFKSVLGVFKMRFILIPHLRMLHKIFCYTIESSNISFVCCKTSQRSGRIEIARPDERKIVSMVCLEHCSDESRGCDNSLLISGS